MRTLRIVAGLVALGSAALGCLGPSAAPLPPAPSAPPIGAPASTTASALEPASGSASASASGSGAASASGSGSASGAASAPSDAAQRFADLGSCALENGGTIAPCRIGYRTFGTLDDKRSNAVLWPTWFTGTTKSLDGVPDKLVDTKRFFLILVDAIGDGVSSSPSNSPKQPRLQFPKFGIRDMVESQRRLVTEVLGITKLYAVAGISMGGMQAIEWSVSHPEMVARALPIVGTPQLTSTDLLLWNAELHALVSDVAYKNGEYEGRPPMRAVLDIHQLQLTTPAYRAQQTSREQFPAWLAQIESDASFDWNDWHRQLEAMLVHDVGKPYGSLEAAAKRVKAKGLVIVAEHDHMVNPGPAKAWAKATGSKLVNLDGPCGHLAPGCEQTKMQAAVRAFLADPP